MLLLLLLLLIGCAPQQEGAQALPTLRPSPTAPVDLAAAELTARLFLDAWQREDYAAMHALISFASQEANPLAAFQRVYEGAHALLTLQSITYEARTLLRESDRVVVFNYDATFETSVLGSFTDSGRNMRLIIDGSGWRVAWSPGDIFWEMGNGATLVRDPLIPSRANIYDRDGVVLADQNGVVVRVNVVRQNMPRPDDCLQTLAQSLNKPPEDVQEQLDRAGANWLVEIGIIESQTYLDWHRQLEDDCRATFRQQSTRRYLRGSSMPHVLGHVGLPSEEQVPAVIAAGLNQETIIGQSGIERSWDSTLRGQPGGRLALVSPTGQRLRVLTEVTSQPSESLWLTIDIDLQEFALRAIAEAYAANVEGWGSSSRGASAVMMDIHTGDVLLMASFPTFDGNALNPYPAIGRDVANTILSEMTANPRVPQLNRATQGSYPVGSTMKLVGAVASLDSGVYDMNYSYVCTGRWQSGNDLRFDWLAGGHGRLSVASALTNSCNPFFYQTGLDLYNVDPNLLTSYALRLGLGVPTGIGDVVEASGVIPGPEWMRVNYGQPWNFSHAVTMAIGQGFVEITPLQMVRMYASIANGGDLLRPRLAWQAGILDQRRPVGGRDVMGTIDIDEDILDFIRGGLCGVTTEFFGTAEHIFRGSPLLEIGVCGKTGTAEAGPIGIRPHAWFVAYAPADDPQVAIVVMVENSGDGSAVAAPLTRRILEYYYFGTE